MYGEKTDVHGGGVGTGGDGPLWKDNRRWEERAGRVNNSYVKISDGAYILAGSLSEVITPPPLNLDSPYVTVAGNKHTPFMLHI